MVPGHRVCSFWRALLSCTGAPPEGDRRTQWQWGLGEPTVGLGSNLSTDVFTYKIVVLWEGHFRSRINVSNTGTSVY